MIKNYRNNNRRRTFRSNDRNFRQNGSNGFNGNADNNSNGRFFIISYSAPSQSSFKKSQYSILFLSKNFCKEMELIITLLEDFENILCPDSSLLRNNFIGSLEFETAWLKLVT